MNTRVEISDNELLLYHYRDGLDATERERIAAALIERTEVASRLQTLVAQLDAVAAMPDEPLPARALQRWHAALERAAANTAAQRKTAQTSRARLSNQLRWPLLVAAISAVVIVIAFRFGMQVAYDRIGAASRIASSQPSRCDCGLKWHLVSTEQQLAELSATSSDERMALIDTVLAQNRMYTIAAERAGDQRLAGALRSFTPILEQLAQDDAGSEESAAGVAQLNFELRVMQARLAAEAASSATPTAAL
jgi:hypothetical protein